jgi:hypothetical protein
MPTRGARINVSRETLTIITLIGMPVLAASCLGMLVRSLVGGGRSWVLWLLVLAALCATWLYVFTGTT